MAADWEREVRPIVDRVFAMDEAAAARQRMESSAHIGKTVLKIAWVG